MDLKEYLGRYTSLRTSIQNDEKLLELIDSGQCSFILSRLGEDGAFSDGSKRTLSGIIFDSALLRKKLAHKNRLFEKYTLRIKEAAERIDSPTLRNFVICRWLYGFNAEKIAEINYYSERHIYRMAQTANRRLFLALLEVMPKPVRLKNKRFACAWVSRRPRSRRAVRSWSFKPAVTRAL